MTNKWQTSEQFAGDFLAPCGVPTLFGFEAGHRTVLYPRAGDRAHDAGRVPCGCADSSFDSRDPSSRGADVTDANPPGNALGEAGYVRGSLGCHCSQWGRRTLREEGVRFILDDQQIL